MDHVERPKSRLLSDARRDTRVPMEENVTIEFGVDRTGRLLLIDEVMTPDSSRFWPREHYAVGRGQPSLDKQPVRDWLDTVPGWDKSPPPPDLPDTVIEATTARYLDVFERLTGVTLDDWTPPRFAVGDALDHSREDPRP